MLTNVTLCAFVGIRKMELFNNLISNNIEAKGNTIDNRLYFISHINTLCKKAAQKIGALSRLLNRLSDSQKRIKSDSQLPKKCALFSLLKVL